MNWVILAFIVCLVSASEILIMKKICLLEKNINIEESILISFIIAGMVSFLILISKPRDFKSKLNNIFSTQGNFFSTQGIFILLVGTLFLINRLLFIKSIKTSPNPGFSHLIVNLNFIIVLILSYFLYDCKVNYKSCIGIFLSLLGIFIVIQSSVND